MKRKTVNSILKGVAGVGLTLGGVSALSDANLVFANEVEQPEQETPGEEVDAVDETSSNESDKSDSVETAKSGYEIARQEYLNSQPDATCTMSTVADDMKEVAEAAKEAENTTEATGEDNTQTTDESREESPKTDVKSREEKLADLKKAVDDAQAAVTDNKAAAKNGKIDASYYREADKLVNAMIEYYAAVEGFDGTVDVTKGWVSNGINHDGNFKQNYLETKYKDALGEVLDIIYYDYVNVDKAGVTITDTPRQDLVDEIDHIKVLEKTPIFAVENSEDINDIFTFTRDEVRNVTSYEIGTGDSKTVIKVDEMVTVEKGEDGEVVTETTVTGNNATGYTVKITKTVKKADGTEDTAIVSNKTYKTLKGFSGENGGKGEVYKKDLPKEPVTEYIEPAYTGPSEPSAPLPEIPETEIEDEDVPLADVPDVADEDIDTDDDLEEDLDEDVTDLEDEDVPLAVLDLDEPVDIPDADVPLSDNPETGDALTATWIGTAAASVAGLFGASRKKRKG